MNAEIVARLESSFRDEWKSALMSASDLIDSVEIPEVLRVKSTDNAHDDMSKLCELVSSMPVELVVLGANKERQLIVILQLPKVTLVADRCAFVLDSSGRAEDMHRLIECLDIKDLLKSCKSLTQLLPTAERPAETLDLVFNAAKKEGLEGIRELCHLMNPSYTVDV